ncbi:hypothetical protein ACTFIU_009164 [Dictyostelium citrinum]
MSLILPLPTSINTGITENDLGRGFSIEEKEITKKNQVFIYKKELIKSTLLKTDSNNLTLIEDNESLKSALDIRDELNLSYGLISNKVISSYIDTNTKNDKRLTFLYTRRIVDKIIELDNQQIQPSNEISKIKNVDSLRSTYGLFYISKIEYGSSLNLKITLESSDQLIINQFKSEINGNSSINTLLNLIKKESFIKSLKVTTSILLDKSIDNEKSQSLDDVINIINSFKVDTERLVPIRLEITPIPSKLIPLVTLVSTSLNYYKNKLSLIGSFYWEFQQMIIQLESYNNKLISPLLINDIINDKKSIYLKELKIDVNKQITFLKNKQSSLINFIQGSMKNILISDIPCSNLNIKEIKLNLNTLIDLIISIEDIKDLENLMKWKENLNNFKKINNINTIEIKDNSTSEEFIFKYIVNVDLIIDNQIFQSFYEKVLSSIDDRKNYNFMFLGMTGSGKTTLIEFILNILTGQQILKNQQLPLSAIKLKKPIIPLQPLPNQPPLRRICRYEIEYQSKNTFMFGITLIDTLGLGAKLDELDRDTTSTLQLLNKIDRFDSITFVTNDSVTKKTIEQSGILIEFFSTLQTPAFNCLSTFITFSDNIKQAISIINILNKTLNGIKDRPTIFIDNPWVQHLKNKEINENEDTLSSSLLGSSLFGIDNSEEIEKKFEGKTKIIQNFFINTIKSKSSFKIETEILYQCREKIFQEVKNIFNILIAIIRTGHLGQVINSLLASLFKESITSKEWQNKNLLFKELYKSVTNGILNSIKESKQSNELKKRYSERILELGKLKMKFKELSVIGDLSLIFDSLNSISQMGLIPDNKAFETTLAFEFFTFIIKTSEKDDITIGKQFNPLNPDSMKNQSKS